MAGTYLTVYSRCPFSVSNDTSCTTLDQSRAGVALMAIGGVVLVSLPLASLTFKNEVVSGLEVRSMADRFNRQLREQLRLADPPQSRAPGQHRAPLSLSLVPHLSPAGGGLVLLGLF